LLRACPSLRLLATSREALRISGEVSWLVPSLSLLDPQRPPSPHDLLECEAAQLFVERAVAALPAFTVTAQNAQAIARTCHQLDGIPLAIELAAARVKVLSADQIATRLDDRFRLLVDGSRTALPRHQTLRATMDWSYGLLSDQEQWVLRRLAIFAGGWTLEASEAVCAGGGIEATDILNALTSLVDKSLVIAETQAGEARYRLLETVRQYAGDRLVESNEVVDLRRRHRDWYVALAERGEAELRGATQVAWLARLEKEHDNLRTALDCSKAEGDAEAWLRLAAALLGFWHMRGYLDEGREWLHGALSVGSNASPSLRARALCGAGLIAWRQGDARAGALLQDSVTLFRELGDNWGIAYSLHHLAHVMERRLDYAQATAMYEESLARFRDERNKWGVGWSLHCRGNLALGQGDDRRAEALLEESLSLCREVGNTWTLAYVLSSLGDLAGRKGDYEQATALLHEAIATARQVGDKYHIAGLQCSLAKAALHRGDNERALILYKEGLILRREMGDKPGVAECLEGLAGIAGSQRDHGKATRLMGAAEALRQTAYRRWPADQVVYDRDVASARNALGESAFAATWAEGSAMALNQAIEFALAPVKTAPTGAEESKQPRTGKTEDLLTPREREIATLVARGLTNREIAEQLVVSQRTTETHVQNILNKLGVSSRAEIAAWAVECGLYTPPAR
jgi:non-specific serine/threonine protein kinase